MDARSTKECSKEDRYERCKVQIPCPLPSQFKYGAPTESMGSLLTDLTSWTSVSRHAIACELVDTIDACSLYAWVACAFIDVWLKQRELRVVFAIAITEDLVSPLIITKTKMGFP